MKDSEIKTTFKGPGEWLTQANELEETSESDADADDALVE